MNRISFRKTIPYILIIILITSLFSCSLKPDPVNRIPFIGSSDSEFIIKNWQLLGPFVIDSSMKGFPDIDHLKDFGYSDENITYEEFTGIKTGRGPIKKLNYNIKNDYLDLNEIFNSDTMANGYAACLIQSSVEQDVAFMCGANDGAKVWVNNQLEFQFFKKSILRKNDHCFKVHLNKGDNFVLIKLYNNTPLWQFHLCLSSLDYVKKYNLFSGYVCFSDRYIFQKGDTLQLNIDTSMIKIDSLFNIKLFNISGKQILNIDIDIQGDWKIPLSILDPGPYRCLVSTDNHTYDQTINYGDFNHVFGISRDTIKNRILSLDKEAFYKFIQEKLNPYHLNEKSTMNVRVLFLRLYELYYFDKKYGVSGSLERKISKIYYDLSVISRKLFMGQEAFSHVPGLHLRSFRSKIDRTHDYYLLYIPKGYKKEEKIPLVVYIPFIEGAQREFYFSWHVAKNGIIDNMVNFSEEYGFAFVSTSSRIFNRYNLNPIVSTASFEAIEAVKQDYSIDEDRIYLYGGCSGGMSALLLANRFPSEFAAVFVEGPELEYTLCGTKISKVCEYPDKWVRKNNILNFTDNYKNLPVLIVHSRNDEKAWIGISKQLVSNINKLGGTAYLDSTVNPSKTNDISMVTGNYNVNKGYSFFKDYTKNNIKEVSFSTSQLKYNKAYWITILDIVHGQKATINAKVDKNNTIRVNTQNVNKYSIEWTKVPEINRKEKVSIVTNGVMNYRGIPEEDNITIILKKDKENNAFIKNYLVEGPINHLFANSFILVKGTLGGNQEKNFSDSVFYGFLKNWGKNYFEPCIIKNDVNITQKDIINNHLVLCGTYKTNLLIQKIIKEFPLEMKENYIRISDKKYTGENLHLNMIFPNPLNKNKYILLLTSNGIKYYSEVIKDMPYKGWYDYEVYEDNKKLVGMGWFDKFWK